MNLEWRVLTREFLGFVMLHNSACHFFYQVCHFSGHWEDVLSIWKHFQFFFSLYNFISTHCQNFFLPKTNVLDILHIFTQDMSQVSCSLLIKAFCNMMACIVPLASHFTTFLFGQKSKLTYMILVLRFFFSFFPLFLFLLFLSFFTDLLQGLLPVEENPERAS